jgi:hypothetical protein
MFFITVFPLFAAFVGGVLVIYAAFHKSNESGTIEGKIRNLRVSRPLYKNTKRAGTRFDFQVWVENNSGRDVIFGFPTIEINLKDGKVHEWKLPDQIGFVPKESYVLIPKSRSEFIRLYLDDVDQSALDLKSLSVKVKDNKGMLYVFIEE